MSNNIYDILNDNNIELEELSSEGFNDIEKKQIKNKLKKSIRKNKSKKKGIISVTIAGGIIIAMLGSGYGTSVAAALKLASVDIASFLGINKNLDRYKTVVGETKSSDGVSIKLNEVVLNGNQLVVSTTTKYEKGNTKTENIDSFGEVFINGKNETEYATGTSQYKNLEMQSVRTYNLKNNQLKGDIDIKIVYSSIRVDGKEVNIKPCVFEFTTNGDELYTDTVELPINHSFKLENGNIVTLNKYIGNVVDTKIFLSIQNINNSSVPYGIQLKGYDDMGNKIAFEPMVMSPEEGRLRLSTVLGQEIHDKATKLTLTPYAEVLPAASGYSNYKQVGEEFTIKIK